MTKTRKAKPTASAGNNPCTDVVTLDVKLPEGASPTGPDTEPSTEPTPPAPAGPAPAPERLIPSPLGSDSTRGIPRLAVI